MTGKAFEPRWTPGSRPTADLVDQVLQQSGFAEASKPLLPTIAGALFGLLAGLGMQAAEGQAEAMALVLIAIGCLNALVYRRLPRCFQFTSMALLTAAVAYLS